MTTPIERLEWSRLAAEATSGPWTIHEWAGFSILDGPNGGAPCECAKPADAAFIACAREAVPRLIEDLERAEARAEQAAIWDVRAFARAILHGDEAHQRWLLEAAEAYCTGRPFRPAIAAGLEVKP